MKTSYAKLLAATLLSVAGSIAHAGIWPSCFELDDGINCADVVTVKGREYVWRYGSGAKELLMPRHSAMGKKYLKAVEEHYKALDRYNAASAKKGLPPMTLPTYPRPPLPTSVRCLSADICVPDGSGQRSSQARRMPAAPAGMVLTDRECYGPSGPYQTCSETYTDENGNLHIRAASAAGGTFTVDSRVEHNPDGSMRVRAYSDISPPPR